VIQGFSRPKWKELARDHPVVGSGSFSTESAGLTCRSMSAFPQERNEARQTSLGTKASFGSLEWVEASFRVERLLSSSLFLFDCSPVLDDLVCKQSCN
jgi:hypothetical protein